MQSLEFKSAALHTDKHSAKTASGKLACASLYDRDMNTQFDALAEGIRRRTSSRGTRVSPSTDLVSDALKAWP